MIILLLLLCCCSLIAAIGGYSFHIRDKKEEDHNAVDELLWPLVEALGWDESDDDTPSPSPAPSSTVPTSTDPTSTDPTSTVPTSTDPTSTVPTSTDPTSTDYVKYEEWTVTDPAWDLNVITGVTTPTNSESMRNGTLAGCKDLCDLQPDCGGFVRENELPDTTDGPCWFKHTSIAGDRNDTGGRHNGGAHRFYATHYKEVYDPPPSDALLQWDRPVQTGGVSSGYKLSIDGKWIVKDTSSGYYDTSPGYIRGLKLIPLYNDDDVNNGENTIDIWYFHKQTSGKYKITDSPNPAHTERGWYVRDARGFYRNWNDSVVKVGDVSETFTGDDRWNNLNLFDIFVHINESIEIKESERFDDDERFENTSEKMNDRWGPYRSITVYDDGTVVTGAKRSIIRWSELTVFDVPENQRSFSEAYEATILQYSTLSSDTCWADKYTRTGGWIQMDLGENTMISGVITMGRNDALQWVTRIKVETRVDGSSWDVVLNDVPSNTDTTTQVTNEFSQLVNARYVRITVLEYFGHPSMRVAAFRNIEDIPPPTNCEGSWEDVGPSCQTINGQYVRPQQFVVTTPASPDGVACDASHGDSGFSPCYSYD